MTQETFRVGDITLHARRDGDALTYYSNSEVRKLRLEAPTLGELLQKIADAARSDPAINDPMRDPETLKASGEDAQPVVTQLPPNTSMSGALEDLSALVGYFRERGVREALALRPDDPATSRSPLVSYSGPLLAYLAGVIRFLMRRQLYRLPGGSIMCPWYVLGIKLAADYGIDTYEKMEAFARTPFDDMDGIQAVETSTNAFSMPAGPTAGAN